jgi:hypothetical protein
MIRSRDGTLPVLERFRAKHALGLDPGVGTDSREENASEQETRASVPIQSERKRLWLTAGGSSCFINPVCIAR